MALDKRIYPRTMKTVAVAFLLAVTCQLLQAHSTHNAKENDPLAIEIKDFMIRSMGDKLKAFLEKFKDSMKTGNSELGVPVLEPFTLKTQELHIDKDFVSVDGEIYDLHVKDLSNYVVNHADIKIAKWNISAGLTWAGIKGKTSYDLEGRLMNKLPFYGAGNASFEVYGFSFATQAKLKVNYLNQSAKIVSFNATKILLDKLKVDITGLYHNEELSQMVSAVISDNAVDMLKDFHDEIIKEVNILLLKYGNEFLSQLTLRDIMKIISY